MKQNKALQKANDKIRHTSKTIPQFASRYRTICVLNKNRIIYGHVRIFHWLYEKIPSKLSKCASSTGWLTKGCQMKCTWMFTCNNDESISCHGDNIVSHSRGKWRMPIYHHRWGIDWLFDGWAVKHKNTFFDNAYWISDHLISSLTWHFLSVFVFPDVYPQIVYFSLSFLWMRTLRRRTRAGVEQTDVSAVKVCLCFSFKLLFQQKKSQLNNKICAFPCFSSAACE